MAGALRRGDGMTAWLTEAVLAEPRRFPLLRAFEALPQARLAGPRSLAIAPHEVIAADADVLRTAVLGLGGPSSPLTAGLAQELARLPEDSAAAGLIAALEERLLQQLVRIVRRRAVDDAAAHGALLDQLAGPLADDERGLAGRLCDGRTADALAQRLAAIASCAVDITAGTGGELPVGPGAGGTLGRQHLGSGQILGDTVGAAEFGCRIVLGPVVQEQAARLRPGGSDHARLLLALGRGMPPCVRWRLELLVGSAPAEPLGTQALGLDLRLSGEPPEVERELLASG